MIYSLLGLVCGLFLGSLCPITVPSAYAKLFSVAIMAMLDAVLGGMRATKRGDFATVVFVSGFLANSLFAVFFVYVGERLELDLYYVALLAFGLRSFKNLSVLRRHYLPKA